ncbi:TPA: CS1-pili formation C-terminal domain-containing protein [Photobacterium damselae]
MNIFIYLFLFLFPVITLSSEIDNIIIPDEFSDVFRGKNENFKFNIKGSDKSKNIILHVTPLSAKITNKNTNEIISTFLKREGVNQEIIKFIISDLNNSVSNDKSCSGVVSECSFIPERYAFGFDYEHKKLILFVNSKYINNKELMMGTKDSVNENVGLVNHFDLNLGYYQNDNISFNFRDESILGLKYGNFKANTYATNDDFEVDEISYNYEWGTSKVQVGKFKYNHIENSTSSLDLSGLKSQESVTLSSSRNLVVDDRATKRKLSYYLPSNGRIEIIRDDQIVYSKSVNSGHQFVLYNDLPSGNYLVTVVVIANGKEILREQKQIYNSSSFKLQQGDADYAISFGKFDGEDSVEVVNRSNRLSSEEFFDARGTYQLTDSTLVGGRVLSTPDEQMYEAYFSQDLSSLVHFDFQLASFSNNSSYYSIYSSIRNLSIGYERFKIKNDSDTFTLDNYLVSNDGYSRITASTGFNIFGGNGYISYINNKADSKRKTPEDYISQIDYWSLTFGYSRAFLGESSIDFSFSYQGDEFDEDYYASILFNIPLSDAWQAYSSVAVNNDGLNEFRNALSREINDDNYNVSSEVGVTYNNDADRSLTTDIAVNGQYDNSKLSSNLYAYAESNGTKSINVGLSSSQIFDGEEFYITSEKSDSYVVINADNHGDTDTHRGLLTIATEGDGLYNMNIEQNKSVVGVKNYKDYDIKLDTDSSNYIQTSSSDREGFSYPGSVITVNSSLTRIKTFITSFEDINKNAINDIKCIGDGCIGIETLAEGVFKVLVVSGSDFELVSNHQTCVTPSLERNTTKIANLGMNYCLPGLNDNQLLAMDKIDLDEGSFYFVGVYTDESTLNNAKAELRQLGLKDISRKVGSRRYLYVQSENILTVSQKDKISSLFKYAKRQSINNHKFVMWR